MNTPPLVSICIITYNSVNTIVEALDSAIAQTYQNIEIVVSDDCSQDSTVELCEKWYREHPNLEMQIVTATKNMGVSGNLNRAVKVAKGEWIKIMAGDDVLFHYSIQRFIDYVFTHNKEVCVSKLHFFGKEDVILSKKHFYDKYFEQYSKLNPAEQYRLMIVDCLLPMPGFFISKRLFEEIGYINERYPFGEEWPTYLTLMKNGYDIPYLDDELVGYRCEGNTLGSDQNNRLSVRAFNDSMKSFKEIRRPLMLQNGLYLQAWSATLDYFIAKNAYYNGAKNMLWRILLRLVQITNPLKYVSVFKRLFRK